MQQGSEALDLKQALGVLRRRLPLIVICVVVVAGTAFGFSRQQTKKYTATASLNFGNNSLSQQIAGLPVTSSSDLVAQQDSNIELVKLGDLSAKTASLIGHGLTEEKVADSLSVTGQGESSVVDVSATATSPLIAAAIANTYTRRFVNEQQSANSRYFKSALALVHKQLAALSTQQRVGADGVELQDRAQTLGLLSELNYGSVQIAQEALTPISPSSPKTSKNTVLGGLLGLLTGLGLAFVLERVDPRIRRPEDLEAIYHLPLLGTIPESATLSRAAGDKEGKRTILPPVEAEAFSLIRAHLRLFNVDRELRTVVIASAEPGDGKTTIAWHLAEAAARLGSRVLLLELDLRHPTLAQRLDIQPKSDVADVLIDATLMGTATHAIDLEVVPGDDANRRTFDVLAAGAVPPPNPGELLESGAMETVLEHAKSAYDLVVIDTPPLAAVSDAFPLLTKVDGVVIVSWLERSRRDVAERLMQVLANSGAPLLGVIANGAKSSGHASYVYTKSDKSYPGVGSAKGASPTEELIHTVKA